MVVRALRPDEPELLRRVRLRALADSPDSFASTLAEEQSLGDAEWTAQAAAADQAIFVALDCAGEPVGMAGGRRHGDGPDVVALWGMWVAPAVRGRRLGAELVDAVARWAAGEGAMTLRIGVMTDVPAAVGFYERLGFADDGGPHVFRRDPSRRWQRMLRGL